MPILNPKMVPEAVPYDRVEKADLARFINRQTRELQQALVEKLGVMRLLAAIIKHPDAFRVNAQGEAELDLVAVEELKENTQIKSDTRGETLVLSVRESTYLLHAEPMRLGLAVQDLN